jgi:glucose-6-phosphate 1-dehydrogenase
MSTATTIAPEAAVTAATTLPGHPAPPATLAIFGAGGDLTKRLVVPALYDLVRGGKLPDDFAIIGVDHTDQTTEGWCQSLTEMMQALTRVRAREHQVEAIDRMAASNTNFTQNSLGQSKNPIDSDHGIYRDRPRRKRRI